MGLAKLTAGERRGMILLLIIIVIITCCVYMFNGNASDSATITPIDSTKTSVMTTPETKDTTTTKKENAANALKKRKNIRCVIRCHNLFQITEYHYYNLRILPIST